MQKRTKMAVSGVSLIQKSTKAQTIFKLNEKAD
jgi:hypothetical protein